MATEIESDWGATTDAQGAAGAGWNRDPGDVASGDVARPGEPELKTGPVGSKVGRYVLMERLGAGGMGAVFAAYDPELERRVAVKVIRARARRWMTAQEARGRLLREGQAMARLSHPNVIAVYDVGTCDDGVFVAMELIEGGTLREWLLAAPRSWEQILEVFVQAGRGLAAAHAAGIIHRDFKPDNALVHADGRVVVTDFGLARAAPADRPSPSWEGVPSGSEPQTVLGTLAYMGPEQFGWGSIDGSCDQFSFCVALYEALYGRLPFDGDALPRHLHEIAQGRIARPPRDTSVPPRIFRLLRRGLNGSPDRRFASMEALLAALTRRPLSRGWHAAGFTALVGIGLITCVVARAPSPEEAGLRARLDELRRDAATGRDQDLRQALEGLRSLATRAATLDGRSLEAEALVETGEIEGALQRPERARDALESAEHLAESAGDDFIRARAAVALVGVSAELQKGEAVEAWSARATAILDRLGGDRRLEALLRMKLAAARISRARTAAQVDGSPALAGRSRGL